jgi:hypothetical protein
MRYSEVQSSLRARIMACPELSRFGEPIVLDPYAPADDFRNATAAAVRAHGVAIEIDWPFTGGRGTTSVAGSTVGPIATTVYLNESPVVAHEPARAELIEILMGVLATPLRPGETEFSVSYEESAKDDKGIITHAIDCEVIVKFPKAVRA